MLQSAIWNTNIIQTYLYTWIIIIRFKLLNLVLLPLPHSLLAFVPQLAFGPHTNDNSPQVLLPASHPTILLPLSSDFCLCVNTHPVLWLFVWPVAPEATWTACLQAPACCLQSYLTLYSTVTYTHHSPTPSSLLTLCTLPTLHLHSPPNWPHPSQVSSSHTQPITHPHIHTLTKH